MRWFIIVLFSALFGVLIPLAEEESNAAEFVVYSVYKGLNLGNPGEIQERDYYVNMGSDHGIHEGTILTVYRRTSTYDLMTEQLYRDVTFPIATIKVIHVESLAAVARLEKYLPSDQTPVITPRAIMVGDLIRLSESR